MTALVDCSTDAVVERYAYTPYTVLDADFSADANNISDFENEYLYTGRRLDFETGLQLNRNRFYTAHLGRWLTRDPIGYDGSQWNLYEYVGSNTLVRRDPLGQYVTDDDLWSKPWPRREWPTPHPWPSVPPGPACDAYKCGGDSALHFICATVTGDNPWDNCVRGCLLDSYDPVLGQYPTDIGGIFTHIECFAACNASTDTQ